MNEGRVNEIYDEVPLLIENKEWDWLLASMDELVELCPYDHRCYYNRAITFVRMGRLEQASEDLRKALELQPDYGLARKARKRIEAIIL